VGKESRADLVEVFYGIQGEGIFVGVPQLFIRFARCNLNCRYCDTKEALKVPKTCKVEMRGELKNPVSISQLLGVIEGFSSPYHSISITGGEPLLQADFILLFLKALKAPSQSIYLETNGTVPGGLRKVIDHVGIIAMDMKLPSVSGEDRLWGLHREFLSLASHKEVFVKLVVTKGTDLDEVGKALSIIKEIDSSIPLVIQPAIDESPSLQELFTYYKIGVSLLKDVRVIPQVHRLSGWK
jgi:organic radical activating enzyme